MGFLANTLMTLLLCTGLLLMFIVLLQRGRGGGLAGAFGGLGGQSAFGTKAGDVFTKITVVLTVIWVLLAAFAGLAVRASTSKYNEDDPAPKEPTITAGEGDDADKGDDVPEIPDPGDDGKGSSAKKDGAAKKDDTKKDDEVIKDPTLEDDAAKGDEPGKGTPDDAKQDDAAKGDPPSDDAADDADSKDDAPAKDDAPTKDDESAKSSGDE